MLATVLKKKHSKTGEESRYQGTLLGIPADGKPVKIEGGPADTLEDWMDQMEERAAKLAAEARKNSHRDSFVVKMEVDSSPSTLDDLSDAPGELDDG